MVSPIRSPFRRRDRNAVSDFQDECYPTASRFLGDSSRAPTEQTKTVRLSPSTPTLERRTDLKGDIGSIEEDSIDVLAPLTRLKPLIHNGYAIPKA
jgi:hypothetical protein